MKDWTYHHDASGCRGEIGRVAKKAPEFAIEIGPAMCGQGEGGVDVGGDGEETDKLFNRV